MIFHMLGVSDKIAAARIRSGKSGFRESAGQVRLSASSRASNRLPFAAIRRAAATVFGAGSFHEWAGSACRIGFPLPSTNGGIDCGHRIAPPSFPSSACPKASCRIARDTGPEVRAVFSFKGFVASGGQAAFRIFQRALACAARLRPVRLRDVLRDVFFFETTRMLSTRLGYARPARRARAFAADFSLGLSFFAASPARLRGLSRFHGARFVAIAK